LVSTLDPSQKNHYRVFLSSPGDVTPEREIARELLTKELPYDPLLKGKVSFEVVSWDDPVSPIPLVATISPQEAITRFGPSPSKCDIVIVILWARLGTHLDLTKYVKLNGERYNSGTEWEFEDAIANKDVEVLVYRRTEEPSVKLRDSKITERKKQLRQLERFLARFQNSDGSYSRGLIHYDSTSSFKARLTNDLKYILREKMNPEDAKTRSEQREALAAMMLVPPHDFEAEQYLLGSILSKNDAYLRVAEYLTAEHFADPLHGRLFFWLSRLIDYGQVANVSSIKPYIEQDKDLMEVGETGYLERLHSIAKPTDEADQLGRTIRDLYFRRRLLDLGGEMIRQAVDTNEAKTAVDQIEAAEKQLSHLANIGRTMGGLAPFRSALSEAVASAEASYLNPGQLKGVATGIFELDRLLNGLNKPSLILLAGREAMGKTTLAANLVFNVASTYREGVGSNSQPTAAEGGVVGFFSMQSSSEDVATVILARRSSVAIEGIRKGELRADGFDRVLSANSVLEELPLFLDDTPTLSINALKIRARRLKRTQGLSLLVVDNLQLLKASSPKEDFNDILSQLGSLAKELDTALLVLCEMPDVSASKGAYRPDLDALAEMRVSTEKCDAVLFLYREEHYLAHMRPKKRVNENVLEFNAREEQWQARCSEARGKAELIVVSNRHGPTGTVPLLYDPLIGKFDNWSPREYDSASVKRQA